MMIIPSRRPDHMREYTPVHPQGADGNSPRPRSVQRISQFGILWRIVLGAHLNCTSEPRRKCPHLNLYQSFTQLIPDLSSRRLRLPIYPLIPVKGDFKGYVTVDSRGHRIATMSKIGFATTVAMLACPQLCDLQIVLHICYAIFNVCDLQYMLPFSPRT